MSSLFSTLSILPFHFVEVATTATPKPWLVQFLVNQLAWNQYGIVTIWLNKASCSVTVPSIFDISSLPAVTNLWYGCINGVGSAVINSCGTKLTVHSTQLRTFDLAICVQYPGYISIFTGQLRLISRVLRQTSNDGLRHHITGTWSMYSALVLKAHCHIRPAASILTGLPLSFSECNP